MDHHLPALLVQFKHGAELAGNDLNAQTMPGTGTSARPNTVTLWGTASALRTTRRRVSQHLAHEGQGQRPVCRAQLQATALHLSGRRQSKRLEEGLLLLHDPG